MDAGDYLIHARTNSYHVYTDAEYDVIIADLWDIVLKERNATNQDLIAYHMIDFDNKLTSYNVVLFTKLKQQQKSVTEFMPWRLINHNDFDNNNIEIKDSLDIIVKDNEDLNFEILLIYLGDPAGITLQF